jgi:FixJ family two-component response regulator
MRSTGFDRWSPRAVPSCIYVIDNDEAGRDSVQTLLESHGYDVRTFTTGEAFLDDFDGRRDACLLLDVSMPVTDGLKLLRSVVSAWRHLPIIMTSSRAETVEALKATTEGMVDCLQKPFSETTITAAIEAALAGPTAARP